MLPVFDPHSAHTCEGCPRLAIVESTLAQAVKRLFGNGQPGELEKLDKRLTKLESWFWRAVGAGSLIMTALQLYIHR